MQPSSDDPAALLARTQWLSVLARRLVGDVHTADDAAQDAWVAALERSVSLWTKPRGWWAQVLRNSARQRARSETARKVREQLAARPERVPSASDALERTQALRAVVECVLELAEPARSTVILHLCDEVPLETIARKVGLPTSTVRSRFQRALAELRYRLERRHGSQWALYLLPLARTSPPIAAGAAATLAASLPLVLGVVTMKKLALAAAVLAVLVAAYFASRPADTAGQSHTASPGLAARLASPKDVPAPAADGERTDLTTPTHASDAGDASSAAGPTSIVVRATWSRDGSPAQGVGVAVSPSRSPASDYLQRTSHTDSAGLARFEDLAPGSYWIEVDRVDHTLVAEATLHESAQVTFVIPEGIAVLGRVIDAAGLPVPAARVWLSEYANGSDGREVATTNSAGRFELRDVGSSRSIAARARGYAPSLAQFVRGKPGDELELEIELTALGGEIAGTVVDAGGTGIAGACVLVGDEYIVSLTDAQGRGRTTSPPTLVRCDAQGRFEVAGVEPGRVRLLARAAGLGSTSASVEVETATTARVTLALEPGATLAGTIRTAGGAPVGGVGVHVGRYGDFLSASDVTASDGTFRIDGLSRGSHAFRAHSDSHGDARIELALIPGEVACWDPVLDCGPSLSGRVVDENGRTLPGMRVGAIQADHPGLHLRSSITDGEGRFELLNWPADANALEVREGHDWVAPPLCLLHDPEPGRADVELVVHERDRPTAFIVARVVGPGGETVLGAQLSLRAASADHSTLSDANVRDGSVRVGPLASGRYLLSCAADGYGDAELGWRTLEDGQTLDLGTLRLPQPGRIRVRAELADGVVLEHVSLAVTSAAGHFACSILSTDQGLLSAPLAPGSYVVQASGGSGRSGPVSVEVQASSISEVVLPIERATWRVFAITWAEGTPPPRLVEFELLDASGAVVWRDRTDPRQRKLIYAGSLARGTYTASATADGARTATVVVEIADLEPHAGEIELALR